MRVDKKRILNPDCNAWYVVPAIALSLFVFAYSTRLGQVSILLFYSVWFGPLMFAPWLLLRRPWPVLALLGVSALFVASVIWSEAPSTTLRSSIQYGTTVACALIAARMTSVPNLALGGSIGGLFIMIYSMINGGYSYDFIDGTYAFTGAFASKNQLGYQATLAIIFSLSLIGLFRAPRPVVIFAVITTVISARLMFLSDSATSLLTAGAALATFFLARIIVALAPMQRRAAVTLLVSGALATAITAYRAGAFDAVLAAFGKDATLTGRTYLWNQAIEIGGARPILGLGYNAFWVAGRPDAERLWDEFYITGRTGFHFHNLLVQSFVDLGLLGLGAISAICVLLLVLPMRALVAARANGSVVLCAALALLFLLRSVSEVDFITSYTAGTFLVSFVLLHLFDHLRVTRARNAVGGEHVTALPAY